MKNCIYLKILKKLEEAGIDIYTDLSPTFYKLFFVQNKNDKSQIDEALQKFSPLANFLIKNKLIEQKEIQQSPLGSGNATVGFIWFDTYRFEATITLFGITKLAELRNQELVEKVNSSILETNSATRRNFCRQTIISFVTVLVALLTGWIAWLTYEKTKANEDIEKRLKLIETIMQKQIRR